jgi:hypothetical protein
VYVYWKITPFSWGRVISGHVVMKGKFKLVKGKIKAEVEKIKPKRTREE